MYPEQQSGCDVPPPPADTDACDPGEGVQVWRWTHAVFWGALALSVAAGIGLAIWH